jgi:cytochrome c oxidase assembly protein subunit 15
MSLGEFKSIFYMEWAHRTYGRVLGVVYAVPLLYFVASGRAGRLGMTTRLVGLLVRSSQPCGRGRADTSRRDWARHKGSWGGGW